MKKNLLYKLSVLVAMVFFTFTACQNEDAALNVSDEPTQAEYDALINALKNNINRAIDTRVVSVTETLNADKEHFAENPDDASLQNSILASAIEIEASKVYKERAIELASQLSLLDKPSDCDVSALNELIKGSTSIFEDYYLRDFLLKISFDWDALFDFDFDKVVDIDANPVYVITQSFVDKLNSLILKVKECGGIYDQNFIEHYSTINEIISLLNAHIYLIEGILDIENGKSKVLADIYDKLGILKKVKANKFTLNSKLYDLKDVYDELQDSLAVHRTDITNLQRRVKYIEEVEIPAIWEGMEFLYDFISDVYSNLDTRVTGLTFKPEYDFGGGLSNLILVRGLSEWENLSEDAYPNYKWQQMVSGDVYKGITYLTYNVSPANAKIDFSTFELVYTTTKIITRSNGDPLLQIVNNNLYPITYTNGILTIPVVINEDAYPLVQTSYDEDATQNIKVALKLTNKGYTAGAMPERPDPAADTNPTAPVADTDDRSVVSSEYVTVWLGLFDGRIAEKDVTKTDDIGLLFPTEIITADFLKKDCSNTDYPFVTLKLQKTGSSVLNLSDSILAVFNNEFEKIYSLPGEFNFNAHALSYELVNLGNSANTLVSLGTDGKITVTNANRSAAAGKTLAVLVRANVNGKVHAVGYVRVLMVGDEKEMIIINNKLANNPITINCSVPVEFTVRKTVADFINYNILKNTAVSNKTNITTADAFYDKYDRIEVNSVSVANTTLSQEELIALVDFNYINGENPYIMGTISHKAPLGAYTVVTTLKSSEYIPDIQITWTFSVNIPQLKASSLLENKTFKVEVPTVSPSITAYYKGNLNNAFQQQNGSFTYNYLNGTCTGFVTPDFVFAGVPAGYTISADGKTILKDGVEAAVIEVADGIFTIRLIEGTAAWGLIGNYDVKVQAQGTINGSIYDIYSPFSVYFVPSMKLSLPTTASFSNYLYAFGFYAVGTSGTDIICTWNGPGVPLKNNKETAKLLIDYYGINYSYEPSYYYGATKLNSPIKMDLANIKYASGSSNTFNANLADLGPTVTVNAATSSDVEIYYNISTPLRYRLKFNANGTTLPSNLRISIPVTIQHRWGIVEDNLIIKVN